MAEAKKKPQIAKMTDAEAKRGRDIANIEMDEQMYIARVVSQLSSNSRARNDCFWDSICNHFGYTSLTELRVAGKAIRADYFTKTLTLEDRE